MANVKKAGCSDAGATHIEEQSKEDIRTKAPLLPTLKHMFGLPADMNAARQS